LHALIIANPVSGRGRADRLAESLESQLRWHGVRSSLRITSARGEARALAARCPSDVDIVVSVGGDGTLSEVIDGLPLDGPPLGLLPAGTANVLALELGLPTDAGGCARMLVKGHTCALDILRVNGRRAFLNVSVGFDAAVVEELERRRRGRISKLSYLGPLVRTLRTHRRPQLAVRLDGGAARSYGQCFLTNVRMLGTSLLRFDHAPRRGDGCVEAYLCRGGRRRDILRYALRLGFARLARAGDVEFHRARKIEVDADHPVPYQVDGDYGGVTPVAVEVLTESLQILTPRPEDY
jgi:YegS/Rv2252/BmrU family lipid kinase